MTPDIDPTVVEIDQAAFALRRLWSKPPLVRHLREQGSEGRPIQLSNLMVINVVAQLNIEGTGDVTVGAVAERLDIDPSPRAGWSVTPLTPASSRDDRHRWTPAAST